YRGNYTAYARKKQIEREQQEETLKRQQEEILRQQEIVQRLRSQRKFNSMHSREKVLEKLQQGVVEKPRDARQLKIHRRETSNTGREVLIARNVEHGFGERTLFRNLTLTLERGERLAIVGPNGAGKTTLLKALAGELPPRAGHIEYGYKVKPAYF